MPGILETEANLQAGTLIVTFDSTQVDEETIIQTIEDLGYTVTGTFDPSGEE